MTTVIWNFVSPSSKSHWETGNVKELQTKQESNSYLHWYREIRAFPFWKGLSPEFPATLSSWGVRAEFDLSGMMAPSQLPVLSSGPFSISKEMLLVCSVPLPLTSQLIIYWETLNEHPFSRLKVKRCSTANSSLCFLLHLAGKIVSPFCSCDVTDYTMFLWGHKKLETHQKHYLSHLYTDFS